jgi:hypothetical protein
MRLEIRNNDGARLGRELRASVDRKLRLVLGRFGSWVGRVVVSFTPFAGPEGISPRCRIVVSLRRSGQVRVEITAADLDSALERAVHRIGAAVSRELMRRHDRRGMQTT